MKYVERRLVTCEEAVQKFDAATLKFTEDPTFGTKPTSKNTSAAVSVAGNSRRSSRAVVALERSQSSKSLPAITEKEAEGDGETKDVEEVVVIRDVVSPKTMKDRVRFDDVKKRGGNNDNVAPILGVLKDTEDTVVFYK